MEQNSRIAIALSEQQLSDMITDAVTQGCRNMLLEVKNPKLKQEFSERKAKQKLILAGIATGWLRSWVSEGKIKRYIMGSHDKPRYYYQRSDLERLINANPHLTGRYCKPTETH